MGERRKRFKQHRWRAERMKGQKERTGWQRVVVREDRGVEIKAGGVMHSQVTATKGRDWIKTGNNDWGYKIFVTESGLRSEIMWGKKTMSLFYLIKSSKTERLKNNSLKTVSKWFFNFEWTQVITSRFSRLCIPHSILLDSFSIWEDMSASSPCCNTFSI